MQESIRLTFRQKKEFGFEPRLSAGQPVNANGSAGGVSPELDELLDGEDSCELFDATAILGMAAFQLRVGVGVPGDPADMSYAYDVAVQVGFKDSRATGDGRVLNFEIAFVSIFLLQKY